ncbi:hypothetical protein BY458DRAFT_516935 [Sporodiniella umbellata]|nr:hypothetical protein BY458DRAFT_516935 [Sporodiniella umbellata]
MQVALPTPTPPPEPETCYTKRYSASVGQIVERFLKELDGRDKAMKLLQYLLKLLMHYRFVQTKDGSTLTSQFSMTRKVLRLGNATGALRELKQGAFGFFLLNDAINGICDDAFCLYKLGWVSRRWGLRAERIAAYCWFLAILKDLRKQAIVLREERAISIDRQEKRWLTQVSIVKLSMDGVFCACDILQPTYSPGIQAWTGFLSAFLASYKLWTKYSVLYSDKH